VAFIFKNSAEQTSTVVHLNFIGFREIMNPTFLLSIPPGDLDPLAVSFYWPNPRPASQPVANLAALLEINITGFFKSDDLLHESIKEF